MPRSRRTGPAAAGLAGRAASADRFEAAAGAALQDASPLRHNGPKVPLSKALPEGALRKLDAD